MPVACVTTREGAHQQPRSARDVEHRVGIAGRGHPDDAIERLLIANRRGAGKRHRLARELVEDQIPVRIHVNFCTRFPSYVSVM
jgi:hypothetical protein